MELAREKLKNIRIKCPMFFPDYEYEVGTIRFQLRKYKSTVAVGSFLDPRHKSQQPNKMADEFVRPEMCVCNEETINALADYGRKSIALSDSLKVLKTLLLVVFAGRLQMIGKREEILYHLRSALPEEEQEMFRVTDLFVGKKGQTVEQKALIVERKKWGRKLGKIFLDLLNGVFPPDDDMEFPTPPKNPPSAPSTPATPATPATPDGQYVPPTPSTPVVPPITEYEVTLYNPSFPVPAAAAFPKMDDLADSLQEVLPFAPRAKVNKKKASASASATKGRLDVPEEVTLALGDSLKTMISSRIPVLVPSSGSLESVLRGLGVNVVTALSDAEAIVAFPPHDRRWDHILQYLAAGLAFFVLLKLKDATTKKWRTVFGETVFDLNIINGQCLFLEGDRIRVGESFGWFMIYPRATGKMSLVHIGAADDVDLGDEDSVGGRGYDSDEKECEEYDIEVMMNPDNKFTNGYLVDGVTVADGEEIV
jgi:hypothetical protein